MYPIPSELREFIRLLNLGHYPHGICFGISAMSVSPPLINETHKYNKRLQKIKQILDSYKTEQANFYKEREESFQTLEEYLDKTLGNDEKIDILAYCKGVAFQFDPKKFGNYLGLSEHGDQNFLLTNSLIEPIAVTERGGLVHAGVIVSYYTKLSDIKDQVFILKNILTKKGTNIPSFSGVISSGEHALNFSHCSGNPPKLALQRVAEGELGLYYVEIELLEKIMLAEYFRSPNRTLVLSINLFCLSPDKEKVVEFKKDWQNQLIHSNLGEISEKRKGQDSLGKTWLHESARWNDIDGVHRLIDQQVDVNISNRNGQTALDLACYMENRAIVEILTSAGADISWTAQLLPYIQRYRIAEFLLEPSRGCQKNNINYILPPYIEGVLNSILDVSKISHENKTIILKLYIIIRENEKRKNGAEYNSRFAQFFRPDCDYTKKLNVALALLKGEPVSRNHAALQSGRLKEIAAFFLEDAPVLQNNSCVH